MSIQNSGITSNVFQTMALVELAQATSQLNTQDGSAVPQSTDCATNNQGSEAQAVLSALEGNLPTGQIQQNYSNTEMEQLLAMESMLSQEQAQAANIGNGYANCMPNATSYDNSYSNGYGYNGYNSNATPAFNAIQNELQIGNEALLLSILAQDSQSKSTSSTSSTQPTYSQGPTNQPRMNRSGTCDSNTGTNTNFNANNNSVNSFDSGSQETSYWSAGSTTMPWLSDSGATPVGSLNPGFINRIY